jgi:ribonuclease HI
MAKHDFKSILIFSDGACSGNPGPGGWGAVIATPDGHVKELGGGIDATTNNQMELSGAIFALKEIKNIEGPVMFYTDSTYVIRGINQWIWGWRKNGWKNSEGGEVLNREFWEELSKHVSERSKKFGPDSKINWLYSRGHIGTPGNERCDEIAVAFSQKKRVNLYDGPLLKYQIPIHDLPEDTTLPEMKPRQEKAKAFSYLSYLGGQVYRHTDWASCERRVKGQSGAKFKKAMSAAEELQILKEWGLSPDTKIKS